MGWVAIFTIGSIALGGERFDALAAHGFRHRPDIVLAPVKREEIDAHGK
jgi:hypothetical protein